MNLSHIMVSFNLSQRSKLYLFFFVLTQLTSDDHSRSLCNDDNEADAKVYLCVRECVIY